MLGDQDTIGVVSDRSERRQAVDEERASFIRICGIAQPAKARVIAPHEPMDCCIVVGGPPSACRSDYALIGPQHGRGSNASNLSGRFGCPQKMSDQTGRPK